MEYTVEYFIAKFEAIPDWRYNLVGVHTCHAYAHCGMVVDNVGVRSWTKEAHALWELFSAHKLTPLIVIEDGENQRFPQPTPKQRILAALRYIQSKQIIVSDPGDETKEHITN